MARLEFGSNGKLILANELRLIRQLPWLERFPKNIKTILDVGAGAGVHSDYFRKQGLTPTAMDYDESDFLYHGEIEFIKTNLVDFDQNMKFDAIFLSHVVEHFPNLESGIAKLRSLLNDGGYLFIVVPPYEPITCDNHWQVGWNCGQLAMTLATCGFDCSEACFVEINQNVCGWGKMLPISVDNTNTDRWFDISRNKNLLPPAMQSNFYRSEAGNIHIPDMVHYYGDEFHRRFVQLNESVEGFGFGESKTLVFENSSDYKGLVINFNEFIDITNCFIQIIVLCEGKEANLRIAVDSSTDGNLSNCAEFYLGTKAGLSYNKIYHHNFSTSVGTPNYANINKLIIGGHGEDSSATIWVHLFGLSAFQMGKVSGDNVDVPCEIISKNVSVKLSNIYVDSAFNLPLNLNVPIDNFSIDTFKTLVFNEDGENKQIEVVFQDAVDFTNGPIQVLILCDGNTANLRIAIDSSKHIDYLNCGDYYLGNKPGLSFSQIFHDSYAPSIGNLDCTKITKLVVGGKGINSRVSIWIFYQGNSIFNLGEVMEITHNMEAKAKAKAEAENLSNLYFFKNKSVILQNEANSQAKIFAELSSKYSKDVTQIHDLLSVERISLKGTRPELQRIQILLDELVNLRDKEVELIQLKASNSYKVFSRYRSLPKWIQVLVRAPIFLLVRIRRFSRFNIN